MNTPVSFILQDFQMNHGGLENYIQGMLIIELHNTGGGGKLSVILKG